MPMQHFPWRRMGQVFCAVVFLVLISRLMLLQRDVLSLRAKTSLESQVAGTYSTEAFKSVDRNQTQACSLDLLRMMIIEDGFFPNNTWWKNVSAEEKYLRSNVCELSEEPVDIGQCLLQKYVQNVAVLGDSNGNQMAAYLSREISHNCTISKDEDKDVTFKTNPSYFLKEDYDRILTHARDCQGCGGRQRRCTVNGSDIIVDFEANEFLLDTELTTFRIGRDSQPGDDIAHFCGLPKWYPEKKYPCPQSHTTQQFLLKEYFPRVGYPDLLLIFTNSHDMKTMTVKELELYSMFLGGLIDLYVPRSTTVVIFSKPYEDMWLKPNKWKRKFEGRDTLEQVKLMNDALARGMRSSFSKQPPNVFPFFDLFEMGRTVTRDWGHDGIHKKPDWYHAVLQYFFKLYC